MTWEIEITWQIKDDIVIVNEKDKFEHVSQTTPRNATTTTSPSHLNSLAFHYS